MNSDRKLEAVVRGDWLLGKQLLEELWFGLPSRMPLEQLPKQT